MINSTTLVGRLTKDPELKYTKTGIAVCRFTVAVNRSFTGSDGERKADFISCIAWRKTAENLANFQRKGNLIGIVGRIETSNFEGQDGKRVFMTDVVADNLQFLEPKNNQDSETSQASHTKSSNQNQSNTPANDYGSNSNSYDSQPAGNYEVSDDDLPF